MSFSSDIKEKLTEIKKKCPFCDLHELAGFFGSAAKIKNDGIILVTENKKAAEREADIISDRYGKKTEVTQNQNIYKIEIKDEMLNMKLLSDIKFFKKNIRIGKECCKGAYIRGAFLGGGSITNPEKSYHMEFDYKFSEQADKLEEVLKELGIDAKRTERKGHTVIYVKGYELIAGILGCMGAGAAAIEIYNISAEKEIRNGINRQMNCENANMDKVAQAYCRHLAAIEKIEKQIGFDKLPETLREAAEIRINYPEDSLKELGERFKKPIGKSGVNHRLNRLMEIAEGLK